MNIARFSFQTKGSARLGALLFSMAFSSVSSAETAGHPFADCPALTQIPKPSYWLCSVGSREEMFATGDLSARVSLQDLPEDPNLVAVGPVEGLRGEITIDKGRAYVSSIVNGMQEVRVTSYAGAVFLAFGAASIWREVAITEPLEGFDAIEAFIREQAAASGLDPETAFPFRIEGTAERLDYHVIFKTEPGVHTHAAHRKAKIMFNADGMNMAIAGVWADADGVGRYTHQGRRSHMHVIVNDGQGAGHVDVMRLDAGSTLFLPALSD